ncbi:MAG TPA: FAD-dependent monooxygenase [Ktedonobacteraceae bacterium]|nr:FAD-dependent monooxygenase [Ktedonobacteraceae bacterium]
MKIAILGGGPAGLYSGLLIKKNNPAHDITVFERNAADVTYGWGVVFSDRTLASFQRADYKSYEQITNQFVIWNDIDIFYRDQTIRCGGHVISGIARKTLLHILQQRCQELGITLHFNQDINDLTPLEAFDLVIAADGVNSIARKTYAEHFQPSIAQGKARYIWLGADKVLDAFTFIFCENEHSLFQVHAYPFGGTNSTYLVECDEASWLNAGLDRADEAQSLAFCQRLLDEYLNGAQLLSNNSKWISFPTLKTKNWHYRNVVLLGDAAHTAHFSIGSGTKLAMEDAIALAGALEQHRVLESALNAYELERKPVVEVFQRAAAESQAYFETIKRYLGLEPMQFAFHLLTRSGRISYDDLRFRDVRFGEAFDRWHAEQARVIVQGHTGGENIGPVSPLYAPAPMFTPFRLRSLILPNRLAITTNPYMIDGRSTAHDAAPDAASRERILALAQRDAGLLFTGSVAVSPDGRITPQDVGIYSRESLVSWGYLVEQVHARSNAYIAIELNHAGRRGATRPRSDGVDRPLRAGAWPLISASALPYSPRSQVPRAMEQADIERVRHDFIYATRMARDAGFDLLQLNIAHGYLLAGFLSPLTNVRDDEYGGTLENRSRFPLEVFDAVRATWPGPRPLSVALTCSDCVKGGFTIEEAVKVATMLKAHGCDMIEARVGQATSASEPAYGRGFLTSYSERIRNEAGIATIVGGYLTTSNEVNTIVAAGRADLCIITV